MESHAGINRYAGIAAIFDFSPNASGVFPAQHTRAISGSCIYAKPSAGAEDNARGHIET